MIASDADLPELLNAVARERLDSLEKGVAVVVASSDVDAVCSEAILTVSGKGGWGSLPRHPLVLLCPKMCIRCCALQLRLGVLLVGQAMHVRVCLC